MSQQQSNRMTNNLCIARTIARVIILMGLRDVEVRTEDKGATLLIILQLLLLLNLLSMKLT
jgi:citrate lyase gamma subunit